MEEILKAGEVAELLRIDKQRLYELVRTRRIPVIRIGLRQYRFSRTAIMNWLEQGGGASHTVPTEGLKELR
jgi:excisionase family DNA binding protein